MPVPEPLDGNADGAQETVENEWAQAPWRFLFAFTLTRHVPLLSLAVLGSVVTGAAMPVESYLYGKVFSYYASYASRELKEETFLHKVDQYVVYLFLVGCSAWLANTSCFALWTIFGSLQVSVARAKLFGGLLRREMEWFDMRKHGVGAMLTRFRM
jgi:ATP-binding cassette, subfamily B (MDR/TAP), member 1